MHCCEGVKILAVVPSSRTYQLNMGDSFWISEVCHNKPHFYSEVGWELAPDCPGRLWSFLSWINCKPGPGQLAVGDPAQTGGWARLPLEVPWNLRSLWFSNFVILCMHIYMCTYRNKYFGYTQMCRKYYASIICEYLIMYEHT